MQELIEIGIRQGTILTFNKGIDSDNSIFQDIKAGRFGLFSDGKVGPSNILLVLTQECGIASRNTIEVLQGKKDKKFNEEKNRHLLNAQDYSKLVLKIGEDFYSFKETELSKVNQEAVLKLFDDELIRLGQLESWQKRRLLDWRRLEYTRVPFPDKFNRAFKSYYTKEGKWFSDFLQENQGNIDSVRVYIDPDDENADEYNISFCALLTDDCSEEQAEEISVKLLEMLTEINEIAPFLNPLQLDSYEGGMDVPDAVMLSLTERYDEFTFANAFHMKEFNLEFLCY
ncbi:MULTISPECIES: hypothetical protein [unclassified Pseudoalteromonas]|uniref:hypothetical protein n=1 Tax=unclassified Pseudoalteromonas TaxID=194690 RepID=UPI00110B7D0D|nr:MULTISPECIES: hypothetical protein [unclassified Pseudoalteromonas]TMP41394.1 hypothetical protein CWB80_21050 [Pseudoalteromonas sp. S1650]TMP64442.1 hypothetical protein CWB79_20700 [Pseudoalteromonas sp. S1649]